MIFSQADISWAEPLIQLATSTGFAGLVWYLVIKHLPSIAKQHEEERARWLAVMERRDDRFEKIVDTFSARIDECITGHRREREKPRD